MDPIYTPFHQQTSPKEATFDSLNGYVYVTNCGSGTVSVINSSNNKIFKNITVGLRPFGATFSSTAPNKGLYILIAVVAATIILRRK